MLTTTVEETFQNVDGYNIEFWLYMNKLNELADEESISILRIVNNNSDSTSSIRFEVIVKKTTDNSGNKVYIMEFRFMGSNYSFVSSFNPNYDSQGEGRFFYLKHK